MNWKTWLKGLVAAVISGAATGLAQVVSTTGSVNTGTAVVSGAGALVGAVTYLMKSPLMGSTGDAAAGGGVSGK
jgi:hypothetical protein